jgi:hypothetical protein
VRSQLFQPVVVILVQATLVVVVVNGGFEPALQPSQGQFIANGRMVELFA